MHFISVHENIFLLNLTSPAIWTVNTSTKATHVCTTKVQKLQLKQLVTEAEPSSDAFIPYLPIKSKNITYYAPFIGI